MSPHTIRRVLAVTHLWLGLIGGLVFSLQRRVKRSAEQAAAVMAVNKT